MFIKLTPNKCFLASLVAQLVKNLLAVRETPVQLGLPRWHSDKESACWRRSRRRCGFDHWVGKIPWSRKWCVSHPVCGISVTVAQTKWRRAWQPTPLFLPGKFQGWRSLAGYSPWGRKRVRHDWAHMYQSSSWAGEMPCRRDRLPTGVFLSFRGGSDGKESTCNAGDLGSIPGPVFLLGESPWQWSLAGYSPRSGKELDMTEWLSTA